jgi:hypothetical protein
MALAFLTDEQISYIVAEQVQAKRPDISMSSVRALIQHWDQTHTWEWRNVISFLRAAR